MSSYIRLRTVLGSALLCIASGAAAEDIDLFVTNPGVTTPAPNVLFILDNSANWNSSLGNTTKRELEHEALYKVLTDPKWLPDDDGAAAFRVGLMHFAHGNSPKGGKVVEAIKDLTASYQSEIRSLLYSDVTGDGVGDYAADTDGDGVLDAWGQEQLDGTNNAPYALMLNEAYRYYAGLSPMAGREDGYDPAAFDDDGSYRSPVVDAGNACVKNFAILIGNGEPDSGEDGDAEAKLRALGGVHSSDPINLPYDNFESNWADEYARFLSSHDFLPDGTFAGTGDAAVDVGKGDQNLITYVIDVHNPESNQAKNKKFLAARAWLDNIAERGGGKYFTASNAEGVRAALEDILNEIQAVNSVFASTTLPVSVNVRGTNLNQVYIGMFRPDGQNRPRWMGNLKLYQLAVDPETGVVYLADAQGDRADSQVTGFIDSSATSFWSRDSNFWSFLPRGTPPTASDAPDGEVVEKGAAAQRVRDLAPASRQLYTCIGTDCAPGASLADMPLASATGAITATMLGTSSDAERTSVINWVRGEDNAEDEDADGSTTDMRASVHGDVLHSRPAVINYNRDGSDNDIFVFYGANDGVFHALKGGTAIAADGLEPGSELWGFVPKEFFGELKTLRDNSEAGIATEVVKPYFVDGHVSVFQKDVNGDGALNHQEGDKVYLYLTMRRGGEFVYALDVSDPLNPRLLWRRDATAEGWQELGQTWSEPRVARTAYDDPADSDTGGTDVLVFGAGYDAAAQDQLPTGTDTKGRAIFVVNAHTGDMLWKAGPGTPSGADFAKTVDEMIHSIPSSITVLDRDRDGFMDRLYVGDTGGNIWRVDVQIEPTNANADSPADWVVHKFASVGGGRKFLYPPDVVYTGDGYDAVLMGSGDREKPFDTTVENRFYMFKDQYLASDKAAIVPSLEAFDDTPTLTEADLYDATDNLVQVGTPDQQTQAQADLLAADGWYIRLGSGEKVVGNAVTLSGTVFFNTNQPTNELTNCANLGVARNYMVNFTDGSATTENDGASGLTTADRSRTVPGGGYPPSPVPVIVEIDGNTYQAVVSGTQVAQAPGFKLQTRQRTFWSKRVD